MGPKSLHIGLATSVLATHAWAQRLPLFMLNNNQIDIWHIFISASIELPEPKISLLIMRFNFDPLKSHDA